MRAKTRCRERRGDDDEDEATKATTRAERGFDEDRARRGRTRAWGGCGAGFREEWVRVWATRDGCEVGGGRRSRGCGEAQLAKGVLSLLVGVGLGARVWTRRLTSCGVRRLGRVAGGGERERGREASSAQATFPNRHYNLDYNRAQQPLLLVLPLSPPRALPSTGPRPSHMSWLAVSPALPLGGGVSALATSPAPHPGQSRWGSTLAASGGPAAHAQASGDLAECAARHGLGWSCRARAQGVASSTCEMRADPLDLVPLAA